MNILTLQGSPHKNGNTASVIKIVEDFLIAEGQDVENIHLDDYQINACKGCDACKKKTHVTGCIQKDDAIGILEKMTKADIVLFASPLYFWGFTGQMKTLLDRTYSLYAGYHQPSHTSMIEGQKQVVLLTGKGPYENNCETTFTSFSRIQKPHKAVSGGELYIGPCKSPDFLDESVRKKVLEFSQSLV